MLREPRRSLMVQSSFLGRAVPAHAPIASFKQGIMCPRCSSRFQLPDHAFARDQTVHHGPRRHLGRSNPSIQTSVYAQSSIRVYTLSKAIYLFISALHPNSKTSANGPPGSLRISENKETRKLRHLCHHQLGQPSDSQCSEQPYLGNHQEQERAQYMSAITIYSFLAPRARQKVQQHS